MSQNRLVISKAAQKDFRKIFVFGRNKWGVATAESYIESLQNGFWHLLIHPEIGSIRDELLPLMRCYPVERHLIYYRWISNHVEIIRILHHKQDLTKHLPS